MINAALGLLSIVSMLCSAFVLVTIFTSNMHKKFFNRIIALISVCDLFGSLAGSMGNPATEHRGICFFQGLVINFSFSCSILWITMLSYSLYTIVLYNNIQLRQRYMHAIVWTVSALKSLLPLTTLNYSHKGDEWCNLTGVDDAQREWTFYFWDVINYLVFVAICIGLVIYWSISIRMKIRAGTLKASNTVTVVLAALDLYPMTIVVSFFLELLIYLCYILGANVPSQLWVVGEALITLHGAFVATIFFVKSAEARNIWTRRLCSHGREASNSISLMDKSPRNPLMPPDAEGISPCSSDSCLSGSSTRTLSANTDSDREGSDLI